MSAEPYRALEAGAPDRQQLSLVESGDAGPSAPAPRSDEAGDQLRPPLILIDPDPQAMFRVLGWTAFGLVVAHLVVQSYAFIVQPLPWLFTSLFDLDEEMSFATWFSTALLLAGSALLFVRARSARTGNEPFAMHWYGLAVGFAVMSVDEVAGLHETLNTLTDYSWTIPGAILVGVLGLVYLKFILHLPVRSRNLMMLAGVIYLGGVIGVESATDHFLQASTTNSLRYQFLTAIEEEMEMIGVVLFIYALLDYMSRHRQDMWPIRPKLTIS